MQSNSKSIVMTFFPGKALVVPTVGTPSAGTRTARCSVHCNLSVLATLSLVLLASLANLKAATVQVQVGGAGPKFTPASVNIQVGDTVRWTWAGTERHSTTSGTPGAPDGIWDSGIQTAGFTFSHTFSKAGSFPYFCTPHGACCGMIGSVTVSAPTTSVTAFVVKQVCLNGNTVQVTLSATVGPAQPAKYRWDFTNNGTFDTALNSNPRVTHNYPDETRITARVRMVTAQGMVRFDTVTFITRHCTGGGG